MSLLQFRPWSSLSQVVGSTLDGDLLQLWYESPSKLTFFMILMLGREDEASIGRVWRGCAWEEKMKKVKEGC